MAIRLINQASPGIVTNEVDKTRVSANPSRHTAAAFVGEFNWGPAHSPVKCVSPGQLYTTFRSPRNSDELSQEGSSFFTCHNYLTYGGGVAYVTREVGPEATNAYPNARVLARVVVSDSSDPHGIKGKVSFTNLLRTANTGDTILYANATYNLSTNVVPGMVVTTLAKKNALLYTEEFNNPYWTKTGANSVSVNIIASPLGSSSNADLVLVANTVNGDNQTELATITRLSGRGSKYLAAESIKKVEHSIVKAGGALGTVYTYESDVVSVNNRLTYSIYAKPSGSVNHIRLRLTDGANTDNYIVSDFNLSGNGSVVRVVSKGNAAKYANGTFISNAGNGWYRCSVNGILNDKTDGTLYTERYVAVNGITAPDANVRLKDTGFVGVTMRLGFDQSFTPTLGNGTTDGAYLWGAQLENYGDGANGPTIYSQNVEVVDARDEIEIGVVDSVSSNVTETTIVLLDPILGTVTPSLRVYFNNVEYTDLLRILNRDEFEKNVKFNNEAYQRYGAFAARYPGELGNSIKVSVCTSANQFSRWTDPDTLTNYFEYFDAAPGTSEYVLSLMENDTTTDTYGLNDQIHVVVIDSKGLFTGTAGSILEKWSELSKGADVIGPNGQNNYYPNVINKYSKYIYALDYINEPKTQFTWGKKCVEVSEFAQTDNIYYNFDGGIDDSPTATELVSGWNLFSSKDNYDIDVVLTGAYNDRIPGVLYPSTLAQTIFDNVVEKRKDCVMFMSPRSEDVINVVDGTEANNIIGFTEAFIVDKNRHSTYVFVDDNWKYQYDPWTRTYRWVPLNGDVAGLCSRTDRDQDPWYSIAGYNRGKIKNVTKLAWNSNKDERDLLYRESVNPVISQPGEGTLLFGDKTFVKRQTAFNRINVRRLFLALEKTVSRAAKLQLFDFNDSFTRARFVSIVEPYLRTVQGRRGIYDFQVICDESNNTPDIIDKNYFVADIYIQPARSINFIQLNFIATKTGIDFRTLQL